MIELWKKKRIVVLVKTYPNLSKTYDETVCVAGIDLDSKEWIRLFPIRFRKLPLHKQFKKWQVIEADVQKTNDKFLRKESHKVKDDSIKIIKEAPVRGSPKQRQEWWRFRNSILLAHTNKSVEELEELYKNDKTSLGLVKPKELVDFCYAPIESCREWEQALMEGTQTLLFGGKYKTPLEKIPHRFSFKFKCDDSRCTGHDMMCEDWELFQLYRAMRQKYDESVALVKVKQKYFDWMKKRDFYFIIGTESRFNHSLIIGLYYPPVLPDDTS
jgi:hypothetical protein